MTDEQAHIAWKTETINLLAEIGLEDYYFDTEHSWRIRNIDQTKIKPISRELNINEKIIIDGIYQLRGVKIPYAESFLV